jgi:murein L,D-transpeptidase YcbB/YkuD
LQDDALLAAQAMKASLESGGNWGTKGNPSEPVRVFQEAAGLTADGIFGPNTRAAAAELGVYLPRASQRR